MKPKYNIFQNFSYALKGILFFMKREYSARILLTITAIVLIAGSYFKITRTEWIALVVCIGLVLAMELMNSAIELLVDKLWPDYHQTAGNIKDLAAGAVLLTSLAAAIIGCIIFAPKLFGLLH